MRVFPFPGRPDRNPHSAFGHLLPEREGLAPSCSLSPWERVRVRVFPFPGRPDRILIRPTATFSRREKGSDRRRAPPRLPPSAFRDLGIPWTSPGKRAWPPRTTGHGHRCVSARDSAPRTRRRAKRPSVPAIVTFPWRAGHVGARFPPRLGQAFCRPRGNRGLTLPARLRHSRKGVPSPTGQHPCAFGRRIRGRPKAKTAAGDRSPLPVPAGCRRPAAQGQPQSTGAGQATWRVTVRGTHTRTCSVTCRGTHTVRVRVRTSGTQVVTV